MKLVKRHYHIKPDYTALKVMIASAVFGWVIMNLDWSQWIVKAEFISPLSDAKVIEVEKVVEKTVYRDSMDSWVGEYVDKYFKDHRRSEVRMIMHCLLHRESGHGASNARGDGGLAIGPLQFHYETWVGYRKLMIKEGLITEIGEPTNLEQAINTTVWAISTGRAKAWGPIYRDINGSDFATCQTPSWYK